MKALVAASAAILLAGGALLGFAVPANATASTTGCVSSPGVAAYDETVIDTAAYDEMVVDSEAHWQRYSWTGGPIAGGVTPTFPDAAWQANVAGDPQNIVVEGAYFVSHGNSGGGDWFYLEAVLEVTHVAHHEAVSHVVHHDAVAPVTCEPPILPPVLNCAEGTVPGWLNEFGDPTSCVGDNPCPEVDFGEVCPADIVIEGPGFVRELPPSVGVIPVAPTVDRLAETGPDDVPQMVGLVGLLLTGGGGLLMWAIRRITQT